ncbi:MAG: zinc-ribbon domain-containing protein [Blastocatellia bacterium]
MFCNQCGTENKDDARFCRNCAMPLVPISSYPDAAQTPVASPQPEFRTPPANPWNTPGTADYGADTGQGQTSLASRPYSPNQPLSSAAGPNQPLESQVTGYQQYQGYQTTYAGYNPPMSTGGNASGRAITAMILSLISIGTCGPFLSIPGMILGKMELNAIREGKAPKAGETFAKIGFWAGLVLTVLFSLVIILYVAIIVMAIAGGNIH